MSGHQGDQIVRISAQWAIVYFGSFFQKLQKRPKFWASFSPSIDYVSILTKNGFGYILGDFFHKLIWGQFKHPLLDRRRPSAVDCQAILNSNIPTSC
jgi:hypothetical protein